MKRAYEVVNRVVDIIGYIGVSYDENGNSTRTFYTRSTPNLVAGSRFKYMKTKIPFGYTELVDALTDAIEQEGIHGGKISNEKHKQYIENVSSTTFEEVMEQARTLWLKAIEKNLNEDAVLIIEKHFGKKMKLSEATEKQKEIVELVNSDLEELTK